MERHISEDNRRINRIQFGLFCIYIFLSFFETYLTPFFGSGTKFFLLFVLFVFLYQKKFKVKISQFWIWYFAWFIFKFLSVSWSNMSNSDFSTHLLSQIGMILFVIVLTGREQNKHLLNAILQANLWVSFLFGILSIIFRGAFLDEVFVARQVLTLFGQQNDPNNCAVYLLVGITLGLYSATIERKKIILNALIVAVNTYALLLTSSRAGFLTLGVIVVCLIIMPQPGYNLQIKKAGKKLLVIAAVVFVTVFIVRRYLPQVNMDRLFIWSGYEGGSGRDIRWENALQLFYQRPIFGWGWGGYNTGVGAIHNTYLTSLCDIGIFGTILFIVPLFLIAIESIKQKNMLAFLIFITGVLPALVLDAINKRFFWNAIVFSAMLIIYMHDTGEQISVWGFLGEQSENHDVDVRSIQ